MNRCRLVPVLALTLAVLLAGTVYADDASQTEESIINEVAEDLPQSEGDQGTTIVVFRDSNVFGSVDVVMSGYNGFKGCDFGLETVLQWDLHGDLSDRVDVLSTLQAKAKGYLNIRASYSGLSNIKLQIHGQKYTASCTVGAIPPDTEAKFTINGTADEYIFENRFACYYTVSSDIDPNCCIRARSTNGLFSE